MRTRRVGPIRFHFKGSRIKTLDGIGFLYAHKGGSAILKGMPRSWTYINGAYLNTGKFGVLVTFRRHVL